MPQPTDEAMREALRLADTRDGQPPANQYLPGGPGDIAEIARRIRAASGVSGAE